IVGLPMRAARSRARDLLNLVGLAGYEDKYPQQLSGGMQQRTAIARAFIHDPKLILMDEPFGALDALTREQMNLEMLRIWRESGKTIIFVTHSIQEAVFLGSHCAVLTAGPARMAEYFPIDLPFPRALPIKTTDEFGAYARRIYASLGLGASAWNSGDEIGQLSAGSNLVHPEHHRKPERQTGPKRHDHQEHQHGEQPRHDGHSQIGDTHTGDHRCDVKVEANRRVAEADLHIDVDHDAKVDQIDAEPLRSRRQDRSHDQDDRRRLHEIAGQQQQYVDEQKDPDPAKILSRDPIGER